MSIINIPIFGLHFRDSPLTEVHEAACIYVVKQFAPGDKAFLSNLGKLKNGTEPKKTTN
jgi:hypothetical protein